MVLGQVLVRFMNQTYDMLAEINPTLKLKLEEIKKMYTPANPKHE